MRNNWFFMDLDGGSPYNLPVDPFVSHGIGGHLFSQINAFMDNSFHQSRNLSVPGGLALQGAFNCVSKFAGALVVWFSSTSSSDMTRRIAGEPHGSKNGSCNYTTQVKNISSSGHNVTRFHFTFRLNRESATPMFLGKILSSTMKLFGGEKGRLKSHPMLSLAAALVPPLNNISSEVLAVPLDNSDVQVCGCMDSRPCEVESQRCPGLTFPELNWRRHAVEPITGIEFPIILDHILTGANRSTFSSEVLVGTGSRIMKIIKIKSLKVYAFGFYVHPNSVCEKLGPKYASISADKLNRSHNFYQDLLREDIDMTVRLVVNCNGMKINTVREAFEKSLRARLLKTNPDTDYYCLRTFGSHFTQDIPLPVGTTIDFRQTAEGQLITEIGGNQIGVVHSKDLCRAFFGMYIGDVPVSEQTKEEIGRNIASIIRRC